MCKPLAQKMVLSKLVKVVGIFYFIVVASMLTIQLFRDSGRYKLSRYFLGKPHRVTFPSFLKPVKFIETEPISTLKDIILIGYGLHDKHTYPIHCDCESGLRFKFTNETGGFKDVDVVVFTMGARRNMSLDDWRRYHVNRDPSQLWVLGSRESPQTCTALLPATDMKGIYNWSFTYHSRSDFPTPYGWYRKFDRPRSLVAKNVFATKKELISWTSSDCPLGPNKYQRRLFVTSLAKYLNISMHGTCGDGTYLSHNDFVRAAKEQKFVLALENSCCSEYITEKFWDALTLYEQVPVVYGATREEYERLAPPNSFIFIQDFTSLKALADHIKRVGANETEYNKYHAWRRLGYTEKQNITEDCMYRCHSMCRIADRMTKLVNTGRTFSFDENSDVYYGGCRSCQSEIYNLMSGR